MMDTIALTCTGGILLLVFFGAVTGSLKLLGMGVVVPLGLLLLAILAIALRMS